MCTWCITDSPRSSQVATAHMFFIHSWFSYLLWLLPSFLKLYKGSLSHWSGVRRRTTAGCHSIINQACQVSRVHKESIYSYNKCITFVWIKCIWRDTLFNTYANSSHSKNVQSTCTFHSVQQWVTVRTDWKLVLEGLVCSLCGSCDNLIYARYILPLVFEFRLTSPKCVVSRWASNWLSAPAERPLFLPNLTSCMMYGRSWPPSFLPRSP